MAKLLRKLNKLIFSRLVITGVLVAAQAFFLFSTFYWLGSYMPVISVLLTILSGVLLVFVVNRDIDPAFKLTWAIPLCVVPLLGGLLYLYVEGDFLTHAFKRTVNRRMEEVKPYLEQDKRIREQLNRHTCSMSAISRYVEKASGFPTYENTKVTYFSNGEDKFADLLPELEKAKHFILLEYFIIYEGTVWESILEILKRKAAEGVEVKLMYDGTCGINGLPKRYEEKLKAEGIDVRVFLPAVPFFSTYQNNRDHRKILVIDGKIAYNGGVNLADEYANVTHPYGHWKDTAVKVEGDAVRSYTLMFLSLWYSIGPESSKTFMPGDYLKYLPQQPLEERKPLPLQNEGREITEGGYVMPYGDGPNSRHALAENVYLDMMNRANQYIHIMTPYFINDNATMRAFKYAAERGTEVILIVPHVPDKKLIYDVTRTNYPVLLRAGVKVYEYTPGFIHAKVVVSDDNKAVVGTINFDFRSLYHHFECATYIFRNPVIAEIEADFRRTLESCQEVTMEYYKAIPWYHRLAGKVLNFFAPLL